MNSFYYFRIMAKRIKKNRIVFVVILLATLLNSLCGYTQPKISFNRIGLEDGLRQVSVRSIHQDHLDRMWFGTRSGLNMWDGERMKSFSALENDSTGLPGHEILKIIQKDHALWILAQHNVVCRLDLSTMKTERYILNHRDIVVYYNQVLVSTTNGLFQFDKTDRVFKSSKLYKVSNSISKMYVDKQMNLFPVFWQKTTN